MLFFTSNSHLNIQFYRNLFPLCTLWHNLKFKNLININWMTTVFLTLVRRSNFSYQINKRSFLKKILLFLFIEDLNSVLIAVIQFFLWDFIRLIILFIVKSTKTTKTVSTFEPFSNWKSKPSFICSE